MKARALAIATLLTACVRDPHVEAPPTQTVSYTLHGDTACLPNVRAEAERDGREWGTVSRDHIRYRIIWDLDAHTIIALQDEPLLVCRRLADGLCGSTTGTIVEVSTAPICNPRAVLLHELGHLAGIPDAEAPDAVMHVSNDNRHIVAADVRACASVGLCPWPGRPKDVTTVTMTVDPAIPPVEADYPEWPHER